MARNSICEKAFVDSNGDESRHASNAAVAIAFKFADGTTELAAVDDFAGVEAELRLHGLAQKLGDSYAGAKTVAEAVERFLTVHENLKEGNWITRAEGAVRTSLLAEALHRTVPDKYPDVTAAAARLKEMDKDIRNNLLDAKTGHAGLIANYEAVKAEAAAERARKAKERAGSADMDDSVL